MLVGIVWSFAFGIERLQYIYIYIFTLDENLCNYENVDNLILRKY